MKVLLLHPDDGLPPGQAKGWDLIVDLGRSSAQTYQAWSERAGCRVINLFQHAHGALDMRQLRQSFLLGCGDVVDREGIDWWEVIFPILLPDLEQCLMLLEAVNEFGKPLELHCTRPDPRVFALQRYLNVKCRSLVPESAFVRRIRHYKKALQRLDFGQVSQIALDKFDGEHSLRRRFARRSRSDGPVFLLPSAYINVSRTAVGYASLLPEQRFLLAVARPGGKLKRLPQNVRMLSLDAYFEPIDPNEVAVLSEKWESLVSRLATPEFRMAKALGVLPGGSGLIRRGLAARDAWIRLFRSEEIVGCLSADDVNFYTSLPLFIARQRKVPSLAVHHGALDGRMAAKTIVADYYLAKGELERDYLVETCHADRERIIAGNAPRRVEPVAPADKSWLVFFTEPYGNWGWRMEDVYQELLPALLQLAGNMGLQLVFKLHPFESVKGHRNLLRKLLTRDQLSKITWMAGETTPELWNKTKFAVTVESSVALECAIRDIPVFLCAWLQRVHGGYLGQYAKFGIGHLLNSPGEVHTIPQLLATWKTRPASSRIWSTIEPEELLGLLRGSRTTRSTIPTQAFAS